MTAGGQEMNRHYRLLSQGAVEGMPASTVLRCGSEYRDHDGLGSGDESEGAHVGAATGAGEAEDLVDAGDEASPAGSGCGAGEGEHAALLRALEADDVVCTGICRLVEGDAAVVGVGEDGVEGDDVAEDRRHDPATLRVRGRSTPREDASRRAILSPVRAG
jgi:hypothetical protein